MGIANLSTVAKQKFTTNLKLYIGFDGFQHTLKKSTNKDFRKARSGVKQSNDGSSTNLNHENRV